MVFEREYDIYIKTAINRLVNEFREELRDKPFETIYKEKIYIDRFNQILQETVHVNDAMYVDFYWEELIKDPTFHLYRDMEIFFNNQYGFEKEFESYAVPCEYGFKHIGIYPELASMYGISDKSKIKKVKIKIDDDQTTPPDYEAPEYWGLWNYKRGEFSMIYFMYKIFSVCFPYGVDQVEKWMDGKAFRLNIELVND